MKEKRLFVCLSFVSLLVVSSCQSTAKKKKAHTSSVLETSLTSSTLVTSQTSNTEQTSQSSLSSQSSLTSASSFTSATPTPSSSSNTSRPSSISSTSSTSMISLTSVIPPEPPVDDYEVIETFSKRMPGEFEPAAMVKMCYPNNMPLSAYKTISEDQKILLLVNPKSNGDSRISSARSELTSAGANMDNITFLDIEIDQDYTYWVRDFSPFYVFNDKQLSIIDFTYNRNRPEQNNVPSQLATYFNLPYSKMDLVHTGGNLMQDGRGTAFSDDLVVNENSSKSKVLSQMEQYTGTTNYVITIDPQGDYIAHIDCWAKIVAPDKIIVAKLPTSDSRYSKYEQVANLFANTKCSYGYNYRVYRVEEPGGDTIAPYTNSLILNKHVYMPLGENNTYNQQAIELYQQVLPGYEIHGIQGFSFSQDNCFLNTDALHCRTHEVPDQNMVFIDSRDVLNGTVSLPEKYHVKINAVSYANASISESNVKIHFSINNGTYQESAMSRYQETSNFTYTFNGLSSGDDVRYYVTVQDVQGHLQTDPTCGSNDPHHFIVQ